MSHMLINSMLGFLWQISKGYRLRPWRSPYLRWRIETYWGWHAESITARDFWRFVWQQRHDLLRFLRWADRMTRVDRPHHEIESAKLGEDAAGTSPSS